MDKLLADNVARRDKNGAEFQRVFGVPLKRYWNNLTGFDVVLFDEEVAKSGMGRMTAAIRKRWGNEGLEIINKLLERSGVS